MNENNLQKKLRKAIFKNWITFFYSLMIPNAIIPITISIILTSLSFFAPSSLLSKIMNLAASILFSFGSLEIKNNYEKIVNASILLQKSKSAIRNLQSIISHCKKISSSVSKFSSQKKLNENNFKELGKNIENMILHIDSGIEDWKDLVPELRNEKIVKKERRKRYVYKNKMANLNNNTSQIVSFCDYHSQQNNNALYSNDLCFKCPSRKSMES